MEFRVLGPMEVVRDDRLVPLGGPKQRVVLAQLLLHANRSVSTATLIDEVWGEDPPDTARNSLQSYVSHLRKALGDDRIRGASGGYILRAGAHEIDAQRFESLVEQTQKDSAIEPAAAAARYDDALALWRGPPFADLSTEQCLLGEIARLNELKLSATERRITSEIAAGRHAAVVGDLDLLTDSHPLRERLWALLMLALYRSGRQGEALAAYQRARTLLVEELGIDPSADLQTLNVQILRQDPTLRGPPDDLLPSSTQGMTDRPKFADETRAMGAPERRRRAPRALIAVAVVVILAATAALVVARRGNDHTTSPFATVEPGIAIIDAGSGAKVGFVPASTIGMAAEAIYADGAFWVLNLAPLSFAEIDPATGRVLRQIASPIDDVGSFTVDGNDLWITHYTKPILSKVDIGLGREVARYDDLPGTGGSNGVLVADGSVWVARRDADQGLGLLARLDPATGAVQQKFEPLTGSYSLAYGDDGAIWTAGTFGDINRIDLATGIVTSGNVGGRNFYVAVGGGYGWTTDEAVGAVYKVAADGSVVTKYMTGAGARTVAYSDGKVWVGNQDAGTVTAIDAATGTMTNYLIDHPLTAIAAGGGRVLIEIGTGDSFEGRTSNLQGRVARLFVGAYALEPPDPALLQSELGFQVEHATCASLLRFADDPPTSANSALEPEVAVGMPNVSPDGRIYTFTVRPGFRFSPPSDQAVTAETFRYSIERALSPRLGTTAPGPPSITDIEGEADFRSGRTEHISGLTADGSTLSITLVAPATDFLTRLTSPFFCPVPLDTPIVIDGTSLPTPDQPGEITVPSAGPYYIARQASGEYTVLLRNPNYTGPRPHLFDAIVLREGISPDQARALVEAGQWDGTTRLPDGHAVTDAIIGKTIGCRRYPPHGFGIDLAAMCPAAS